MLSPCPTSDCFDVFLPQGTIEESRLFARRLRPSLGRFWPIRALLRAVADLACVLAQLEGDCDAPDPLARGGSMRSNVPLAAAALRGRSTSFFFSHLLFSRFLPPSLPPNQTSAPNQEWKGYIFKIMGGQDKQGFPMKQGVLVPGRVRLLMTPGDACFRGFGRRSGERRRKSVRGCVVSPDLSVLNLVVVKKGAADVPGLTDEEKPRMRGPKRASKIRKLFNLTKDDDVRKYVNTYRRKFTVGEKTHSKAPKIQRLVTPQTLQRKRARKAEKVARVTRSKAEAAEYHKLLVSRLKAARERRSESIAKKRAVRAASVASKEAEPTKK